MEGFVSPCIEGSTLSELYHNNCIGSENKQNWIREDSPPFSKARPHPLAPRSAAFMRIRVGFWRRSNRTVSLPH
jgi:hypothetical protein